MGKSTYWGAKPKRIHKNRFWQRGEPLTERNIALLKPVAQQALKLGRSPTRREVENLREIRTRFRIWEDVLYAIGLPSLKDPEQVKLRAQKNRNG